MNTVKLSLQPHQTVIQAQHLDQLIDIYLADVRGTIDDLSVTSYRYQIAPFREWWRATGAGREYIITERAFSDFLPWAKAHYRTARGRRASTATMRSCCVRVRQFLKWLYHRGYLPTDVHRWAPMMAKPTTRRRFLTLGQCRQLFDAVPTGALQYRDRALLAFLLGTGARRFEAASALWADLVLNEDMTGHVHLRKVKGDKDGDMGGRVVVFGPATGHLIHFHRQFLKLTGTWGDDPRVFGMTNTAIRKRLEVIGVRAGLPLGSHDLRRTFADHWFNANRGGDRSTWALKLQMGHALGHDVTASHYLDLGNRDRVAEVILSHYMSPVELIGLNSAMAAD